MIHSNPIKAGSVALIGAGPGAKDLITLRGFERLQQADIIFYDRLVDPDMLAFARPEAHRVYVGKAPGCHSWPQEKISAMLVAAAQAGQAVVRLKCGDPGIFARGTEEISALHAAGIAYEIIPGVTAASGAAAAAGLMLTEREEIDTLVLTTGHHCEGIGVTGLISKLRPGTCLALYMAVSAAPMIVAQLAPSPFAKAIEVTVVANAQMPTQKTLRCDLTSLEAALQAHAIRHTAIILLKLPFSVLTTTEMALRPCQVAPVLDAV